VSDAVRAARNTPTDLCALARASAVAVLTALSATLSASDD
jgi:hypothetical protein